MYIYSRTVISSSLSLSIEATGTFKSLMRRPKVVYSDQVQYPSLPLCIETSCKSENGQFCVIRAESLFASVFVY